MGNFLSGAYTPHPNSLMFNVYPIFWPFKAIWFFRKVNNFASKNFSSEKSACLWTSPALQKGTLTASIPESTSHLVCTIELELLKRINSKIEE